MDTSHNCRVFYEVLERILNVSQAILACPGDDLEALQKLMMDRETAITDLDAVDLELLYDEMTPELNAKVLAVQTLGHQLEARFSELYLNRARQLREVQKSNQALTAYKFPQTRTGLNEQQA